MSTAEFGSEWTGDGDSGFKFDVNSDGAVVAVAQRDPAHPDATALLRPVSVDAEIRPSS